MTPKEIAHDIIEQENVFLAQAHQLAQAYLALESRIQKLEAALTLSTDALINIWENDDVCVAKVALDKIDDMLEQK